MQIHDCVRFILTGTPIQNNLTELFNLLHFVAPKYFTDNLRSNFVDYFNKLSEFFYCRMNFFYYLRYDLICNISIYLEVYVLFVVNFCLLNILFSWYETIFRYCLGYFMIRIFIF